MTAIRSIRAAAALQRQRDCAEIARAGYRVGSTHLSFAGPGHVRAEGTGCAWVPVNCGGPK